MSPARPSLDAMLAAHDEAALIALTSKGLLRRAMRDCEAGKASVLERDEAEARLVVDGENVTIDAKGPGASRCTCPASGVCRHMVSAVLTLRAEPSRPEDPAHAAPSAQEEILALDAAAIEAFAGADWPDAIALARQGGAATPEGGGLSVSLPGHEQPVVFIAGAGLRGAVFKGAKSRARRATAAAALVARAAAGVAPPEPAVALASRLDQAYLEDLTAIIERAALAALTGAASMARDALFDSAVSARAEAAPRLAGALRGLSQQAALAEADDVRFQPDAYLRDCARAFALAAALKSAPDEVAFSGALRRDHQTEAPVKLHVLGAISWRTLAGARGLRVYGYDLEGRRWLRAGPARGAGADPAFEPRWAYAEPLWGAASIEGAMGRVLRLPTPRISAGGWIAGAADERASLVDPAPSFDARGLGEIVHRDWAAARADLAARFGEGLRRGAAPEPLLLAPRKVGAVAFDEVGQEFSLPMLDREGAELRLVLPPDEPSAPHRIRAAAARLTALLVEVNLDGERLKLQPVSAIFDGEGRLDVWNIGLDQPRRGSILGELLGGKLGGRKVESASHAAIAAPRADPVVRLAAEALEIAVEIARGRPPPDAARRVEAAENLGLMTLARALDAALERPGAATALPLAYAAGEVQTLALMG